jgi:molybdate transport system regulatory protein
MAKTAKPSAEPHDSPRLRVLLGAAIAIGPGKADLLDAIAAAGSISAAASARGGAGGGGARLTPLGEEVLARYRDMEAKALESLDEDLAAFTKLMR